MIARPREPEIKRAENAVRIAGGEPFYTVGRVILEREVPTEVKRAAMSPPSTCAPVAIARATKTMSIAYSVAVAPL
jgi:hypothetical protein